MRVNVRAFFDSLAIMVEGMLGVFAVMLLIIAVIAVLSRLTSRGA